MEPTLTRKNYFMVYGGAILFSLIVGFSFLGVKTAVGITTPLMLLTYRFNFAALGAIAFLTFGRVKLELANKPKKFLFLNASFYLGFMVFQSIGLLYATSILSGIVFAIVPILAKLIAWWRLGESGTWKQTFFVFVSVTAVILMFLFSTSGIDKIHPLGLFLLFLSSLSMAISNVFMRWVRSQYKPISISIAIALIGCVAFNLATIVVGLKNGDLGNYFLPMQSLPFIVATAFLGIPSTLFTALLMAYMLIYLPTVKAAVFGNLSTAISILVGVIVLREPFTGYQMICTALIIVGVIGTSVTGARGNASSIADAKTRTKH
jgi:drug/metabolite transporter (DMT)-like permease